MKDKTMNSLILVICLLCGIITYLSTKASYYKQELEYQQMKYEILIKEPRIKNIIESGGWKMEQYKETLSKLKARLLFKNISKLENDHLVLSDGTKINFECSDYDCCAFASGEWKNFTVDGFITNIQLLDIKENDDGYDQTYTTAKLVLFHNKNEIAKADLYANNGNGDYYYSVLSVYVNEKEIGTILNSRL